MQDLVDSAAGIAPDSALHALRRERPTFVEGTEACRASVLAPEQDSGLGTELRTALAARMAQRIGESALAALYRAQLPAKGTDASLLEIADGKASPADAGPRMIAILRHVDLVTDAPAGARRSDIEALAAAGLDNPQIVALSELIAFVAYEARVVAGLRLMETLP